MSTQIRLARSTCWICATRYWTSTETNGVLFSDFFGRPQHIPAIFIGYPAKSLFSLFFKGHTELFEPHPIHMKDPTPPEDIQTQNFVIVLLLLASKSTLTRRRKIDLTICWVGTQWGLFGFSLSCMWHLPSISCAGTSPILKKGSENLGWNFGVSQFRPCVSFPWFFGFPW